MYLYFTLGYMYYDLCVCIVVKCFHVCVWGD